MSFFFLRGGLLEVDFYFSVCLIAYVFFCFFFILILFIFCYFFLLMFVKFFASLSFHFLLFLLTFLLMGNYRNWLVLFGSRKKMCWKCWEIKEEKGNALKFYTYLTYTKKKTTPIKKKFWNLIISVYLLLQKHTVTDRILLRY